MNPPRNCPHRAGRRNNASCFHQVTGSGKVALGFNALYLDEEKAEEVAETVVVIDAEVGFAVAGDALDNILILALLEGPGGNEMAVAHVRFLQIGAGTQAGELHEEGVADERVVLATGNVEGGNEAQVDEIGVHDIIKGE